MKLAIALAVLAATAAPAAAEDRSMFVTVAGSVGVGAPSEEPDEFEPEPDAEGTLMGRLVASWEVAPPAYKEPKGVVWDAGLAPEILIGVLRVADHRNGDPDDNTDSFVAVGGRLEARLSQRKAGLLGISARGGMYAAARVGLLTDTHRTPLIEGAIGEYIYSGDTLRFGFEFAVMGILGTRTKEPVFANRNGVTARAPWLDNSGNYVSAHLTLSVGFAL